MATIVSAALPKAPLAPTSTVEKNTPPRDTTPPAPLPKEEPVMVIEPEPEPEPLNITTGFTVTEVMPRFPGCEDKEGNNEKKTCADQKLMQYIYSNLQYPPAARANEVEGMAVISFNITTAGKIEDVRILRDPGHGTGEEAARLVRSMNDLPERWTPGTQRGKPIAVRYNLPVRFKLN